MKYFTSNHNRCSLDSWHDMWLSLR